MNYPFVETARTKSSGVGKTALLLAGFWLIAQLATIPFLLPILWSSGIDAQQPSASIRTMIIVMALMIGPAAMALSAIWWSSRYEARTLIDLGIRFDGIGWAQYRIGLRTGFLFAFSLILVASLISYIFGTLQSSDEATTTMVYWQNLADPVLWLVLFVLFIAFCIQGGAEEIVCRGWLLSNITARLGLPAGLMVSSALFALLHGHLFFIHGLDISVQQILIGSVGLGAMFAMGLMLAMIAMRDRSIMGAAGMHSGFNFLALSLGVVFTRLASEETSTFAAIAKVFEQSTSLQRIEPALVAQVLLALFVAWVLLKRFGLPRAPDHLSSKVRK